MDTSFWEGIIDTGSEDAANASNGWGEDYG